MFNTKNVLECLNENNVKYTICNEHNNNLLGFSSLKNSKANTITWIKDLVELSSLKSSLVIVNSNYEDSFVKQVNREKMLLIVDNPRLVFAILMREFNKNDFKPMIMPNSTISKSAKVGKNVFIGNNVVVGENVVIREGTYIHSNVVIHDNVKIGKDCVIHVGAVVGSVGFGYEKDYNGEYFNIPHLGGVIIHDKVSIGVNTCIDRGVIDDTVINENTKIDNLCHIAHNCIIGKNNMITASTMIAGSVVTGENVWFAPCSVIKNGLHIGDNSLVGLGAVATKNVEKSDIVAGVPAKSLKKR